MTIANQPLLVNFERGGRRQAIVESLLADVFQGRLRAGQHLVTQQLSRRFGVSHTPIREALISLAGVGIIDLAPNRGAVVRRVTAQDVREICQVRRALECEATRQACGRIDLTELHRLADELRRLQSVELKSAAEFIEEARAVDSRLHDLIAQSCGNKFLARELSRLKILFRGFRDVSYLRHEERNDLRRLAEEAREHLAIVEGLLAGDGRAAAKAMAHHIRSGLKYWTRSLPETIEPSTNGKHKSKPAHGNGKA
jgi:DNA-binding GntR family transcriptional regulator